MLNKITTDSTPPEARTRAELKLARTIWVVFSWFSAAVIAAVAAGLMCKLIVVLGATGIILGLASNFAARWVLGRRGDRQTKRTQEAAEERLNPEQFAGEDS